MIQQKLSDSEIINILDTYEYRLVNVFHWDRADFERGGWFYKIILCGVKRLYKK